jgi:hypothetical protein
MREAVPDNEGADVDPEAHAMAGEHKRLMPLTGQPGRASFGSVDCKM